MNQGRAVLLGLLFLLFPAKALGQKSCLPSALALQTLEQVAQGEKNFFSHALSAQRAGEPFTTRVLLQGKTAADNPAEIELKVLFDPQFGGVSLPYNLYAVLVVQNGEVLGWWDFTNACTRSGLSFFPGGEIRLPSVKLVGEGIQSLQIMVWGKL